MAVLSSQPAHAINAGVVLVAGSFRPVGAGADACTVLAGRGFTVSQAADNVFTVTFSQRYPAVLAAFADVAQDTPVGDANFLALNTHIVSTCTEDGALMDLTAKTLTIKVLEGAGTEAASELDGDPSNTIISFLVVFVNTSVSNT